MPRNAVRVCLVLLIGILGLVPATVASAGGPREGDGSCRSCPDGARHVACALADTVSAPVIVAYVEGLEEAVRAAGVDVAPHTFVRWITLLGRIAAQYCEEGELP